MQAKKSILCKSPQKSLDKIPQTYRFFLPKNQKYATIYDVVGRLFKGEL